MLCSSCISGLGAESSHGVAGWVPSSSMLASSSCLWSTSPYRYVYVYIMCIYIIICINIHQCQPQHQRLKSTTIHYHHLPSSHRSSLNKHVESTPAARQLFTVLAPVDVHPGGLQLAKTGQRHVVVTPGIQTSGEMGF